MYIENPSDAILTSIYALIVFGVLRQFLFRDLIQYYSASSKVQELIEESDRNSSSEENDELPTVTDLFVYPVKSMRSISVKESHVNSLGFELDRRIMVVRPIPASPFNTQQKQTQQPSHTFVTQRQTPSLATISVAIPDGNENSRITLTNESTGKKISFSTLDSDILGKQQRYNVKIWDDVVVCADLGDEIAEFVSTIVSEKDDPSYKDVRLVAILPSLTKRLLPKKYTPFEVMQRKGSWSLELEPPNNTTVNDGFPLLVASTSSLQDLNDRLKQKGKKAISMSNFRPNIVISGPLLQPFEEDTWKLIQIGNVILKITKACPRCKQSCTNQLTGERSEEPLETMAEFRKLGGDENDVDVYFAQNAVFVGGKNDSSEHIIRVGDKVKVLSRGRVVI